jgi:hypothetical protein
MSDDMQTRHEQAWLTVRKSTRQAVLDKALAQIQERFESGEAFTISVSNCRMVGGRGKLPFSIQDGPKTVRP